MAESNGAIKRPFTLASPFQEESVVPPPVSLFGRLNIFAKRAPKRTGLNDGEGKPLPIPLETYINQAGNIEKTPVTQFSWKFLRDMLYNSDLLSLIARTKTNETFRNGVTIAERFQSQCLTCGRKFEEEKLLCPVDGGEMKKPDYEQWKVLDEFLGQMNRWDESLMAVMKEVDTDLHIGDNGWLFMERWYDFDDDGKITVEDLKGVIRLDPNMMQLIMSRYGMGTSETGTFVYFCPLHRQEISEFGDKSNDYKCTKCGKQLLPAWYRSLTKAERIYYGPKEVYHIKLYSNAQGYGVSPLMACFMKVNALMRMDKFVLEAYSLQRAPQELLILRGKRESIHRAWEWLMQKARENPNMVYPLVIEGDDGAKTRIIEHETFSLKPIEWNWTEMRQEYRNVVGAVYGVQPIFSSGAQPGTSGLANEGLQLAVTTLAIKQEQEAWNQFLEFVSRQLGATDYEYHLNPNEQEDELRDLDVETKRLGIAQTMVEMGYALEVHQDAKGRLEFSYKERPPEEQMPDEQGLLPEGVPTGQEKDMPPLRDAMTPEEQRQEGAEEQRRLREAPRPPVELSSVSAGLDKANYSSKPDKKIRRMPRGDETADTTMVVETNNMNLYQGHAGSPG